MHVIHVLAAVAAVSVITFLGAGCAPRSGLEFCRLGVVTETITTAVLMENVPSQLTRQVTRCVAPGGTEA